MVWKFQKPNWKFDRKQIALDVLHAIDLFLWSILMVVGGAWAVTQQPETLATLRQYGGQMFMTWAVVSFGFSLAKDGLEWWLNRGASNPDSSDRVRP